MLHFPRWLDMVSSGLGNVHHSAQLKGLHDIENLSPRAMEELNVTLQFPRGMRFATHP